MTENKEKHQQQILFDVDITDKPTTENTQQIIVNEQDWVCDEQVETVDDNSVIASKKPSWLWRTLGVVFVTLVAVEAVQFFVNGFSQSPIIASLYAILLAGLSLICGRSVWREFAGLRQFKYQQNLKQQAQDIINEEGQIDAISLCDKISQRLPVDLAEFDHSSWQQLNLEEYNDVEIMQLYARNVLSQVDQKALKEIAKFSSESVVLVALSPIAIIDMLLMLWRNLRLVNKIAALYGLKLSYWSRVKLIKQVIINMAYAGASELVADLGADLLGAELLGKLSARMAQGLGAGMLTARLGLKAMHLCRPIPFTDDAPKLGHIRQQIVSQVQSLVKRS
ncbi:TIGR01620 family protein [Colwellia sp. MB02u-18]|uniref:YcjF family protein n=1 Tax=unclassified Colwellia TaxID=196834 RepID=UPI0015F3E3DD|nr:MULTISPECIES: TIGR01620 family protein [unclassified Colwellia]MBA6223863.1 TIGR01620 family protein [Colwellia sp. MB3u-45]MBA6267430.1 TIGR01620 family protein [Colwellia sp. MB3u-43]MBA6320044.1 TIGR01620 family protein [Colwellia sp. MB02u-19]MBA6324886.1 TIGR01620 family protein [Colwellia sp. MB02u-18]MBA6330567.1 TIGR01620 family protein [Colwellia sp. MB02u-12]